MSVLITIPALDAHHSTLTFIHICNTSDTQVEAITPLRFIEKMFTPIIF